MDKDPLKKRDLGLAGIVVVICQTLTNYHSSGNVSDQVRELRLDLEDLRMHQEKHFVRKEEIKSLELKLDDLKSQVIKLNGQIDKLSKDYAGLEDPGEYACMVEEKDTLWI